MVMRETELWLRQQGNRKDQEAADIVAGALRLRGKDVPLSAITERTPKVEAPEGKKLDLQKEWKRQMDRFVMLGFHEELHMSKKAYGESLPRFAPQPESFHGRFDIPLLVETRIPVAKQAQLAKVNYFLENLHVRDWEEDPQGYKTPGVPYTTWVQDGRKNLGISVEKVRTSFASDERGATEYDGIAFYITHPEVLQDHFLDLPGTSVESGLAPYLCLFGGESRMHYYWVGGGNPKFGSLSCGSV